MRSCTSLIITLSLLAAAACYSSSKTVAIAKDIEDVEYSPDQKYLVASSDRYVDIYNGVTGNTISRLVIPKQQDFRSLSFSQDGLVLGLGYANGDIILLQQQANFSLDKGYRYETQDAPIQSLCFTADNRKLIFLSGEKNQQVGLIDLTATANITYVDHQDGAANFLECSPIRSGDFIVGGGNSSTLLYEVDLVTQEISVRHKFALNLTCGAYTPQGSAFYAATSEQDVLMIDPYDFSVRTLDLSLNITTPEIFTKIRVNKQLNKIVLASRSDVFSVLINDTAAEDQFSQIFTENYATKVGTLALSPTGGNLFYIDLLFNGQLLQECEAPAYYNPENGECVKCASSCSACLNNVDECYQCQPGFYLRASTCTQCNAHCQFCLEGSSCVTCVDSFQYQGGLCLCGDGTYFDKDSNRCNACPEGCATCSIEECSTCERGFEIENDICVEIGGLPDWAVVLIALAALVLLYLAYRGLSAYSSRRKQQRQQRLLRSEEDVPN